MPYKHCELTAADPRMYEEMKALWRISFGDTADTVDRFFEERLPSAKAIAAMDTDGVTGAAYLLPASYKEGGVYRAAYYVYALAVLPRCRGRGIGRTLMEEAFRIAREEDAVCLLMPDGEGLAQYYEGLGMKRGFRTRTRTVPVRPGEPSLPVEFTRVTAEEYTALRDGCFGHRDGYVRWDAEAVRFALADNERSGGFTVKIREKGADGAYVAMARTDNRTLFIPETTLPEDKLSLLCTLAGEKGFENLRVRLPAGENGSGVTTGMIRDGEVYPTAYLGLTLD